MKTLYFFIFSLISNFLISQVPGIEWQNTIGANQSDDQRSINPTFDGGFIIGGTTYSDLSVDKTGNAIVEGYWVYDDDLEEYVHFNYADLWIVKTNSSGAIEWDNTIGGDRSDIFSSIEQTSDGGYIIGSSSKSGISGDKTAPNWDPTQYYHDYWIIKLDFAGNIEWQQTIGGIEGETTKRVFQTSDGGYMVGGTSTSYISGNKTEILIGGAGASGDIWIVKLNSAGTIIWQNDIGGPGFDDIYDIEESQDGGYIIGATSNSNSGGDKAEGSLGQEDYWIIKLNTFGVIEWENTIGGNNKDYLMAIDNTNDGGFVIGGYSRSPISGDKIETSNVYWDYWILKLNSAGNIQWQNTITGEREEFLYDIKETSVGNFIVVGKSNSLISGDKTDSYYGPIRNFDIWFLNLSSDGNIIWQKTIGGDALDSGHKTLQNEDGSFILGGTSLSSISYDKTENCYGDGDFWIMKLECFPEVEICNSFDENCNGIVDDGITETITIYADGPTVFCTGGSVLLSAIYSGETTQWKRNGTNILGATSSSYTVTTKGTYTCETTSACDTELSTGIFVNVQKNPPASITAGGATTFCAGGSVILTANTGGGLSYKWYKDAVLIPGATSINYTATTAGFYKCNVTKTATGCNKNSNGIMVTVPCKEGEELISNSNFTIFPNPNNGTFNLVCNSPLGALFPLKGGPRGVMTMLEIFNSLGQQIHSQQINSPDGNITETISINNLSSGIYFVRLNSGNLFSEQKLIIE
jgi:hypothetical protein